MRHVEAPDTYWAQVINSALTDDRLSFNQHRLAHAEDLAYRYAVTAVESDTGALALVEFRLVE